jgi:hypothetical protein
LHRLATVDVVSAEDEHIRCSSCAVEDHGDLCDVGGVGKELPACVADVGHRDQSL